MFASILFELEVNWRVPKMITIALNRVASILRGRIDLIMLAGVATPAGWSSSHFDHVTFDEFKSVTIGIFCRVESSISGRKEFFRRNANLGFRVPVAEPVPQPALV